METLFKEFSDKLFFTLKSYELLTISFSGEQSNFIRINESKVRQATNVIDADVALELIIGNKKTTHEFTFTNDANINLERAKFELNKMRSYIMDLPQDPFIVLPEEGDSSRELIKGDLIEDNYLLESILHPIQEVDCSGIWASGKILRGNANCKGVFHWFETDNYSFDFSLITEDEKMVKETYAGNSWNQSEYEHFIENSVIKSMAFLNTAKL